MWSVTFCQDRSTDAQTRVHSQVIDKAETIISGKEVNRSSRCWSLSDALFNLERGLEDRARVSASRTLWETGSAVQQRSQNKLGVFISVALGVCVGRFCWFYWRKTIFWGDHKGFRSDLSCPRDYHNLMLIEVVTFMNADAKERLGRLLSGQLWL